MKRFTMAIAIACFLSASALAGDIPCPGAPSPASDGATQTPGATSPGIISTPPGDIPTGGFVSDAALSALLTVLSLAIG